MTSPADFFHRMPSPADMTADQLAFWLEAVRGELDRLDREEPEDMESEEYDAWADRHEALEDIRDEIEERLEEFGE